MNKLKIKVIERAGVVWEGAGTSCSMKNERGNFDILLEHTQFVSPIFDVVTVRDGENIVWEYTLPSPSLCRVHENMVEIWVGV